jgi:hypothetical protein
MATGRRYRDGLVDLGTGLISREIFVNEHNLRNLYRRWAEFMDAESWNELATWRAPAP